jgi:hypothetical protein
MRNFGRCLFVGIFLTALNSGSFVHAQTIGGGGGPTGNAAGELDLSSCQASSNPGGAAGGVITGTFSLIVTEGQRVSAGTFLVIGLSNGAPTDTGAIVFTYQYTTDDGFDVYSGFGQVNVASGGTFSTSGSVIVTDPNTGAKTTFRSNVRMVTGF